MTKLQRVTNKIFGENATATGDNPNIGQFGSALAGTYVGTTDIATIQSLPAWEQGWIGAVTPSQQFPALPEMTGVMKVLSYQTAYNQQMGIPEYDNATIYYINSICQVNGEIYKSKVNDNQGNDPTAENSIFWELADKNKANTSLNNLSDTGKKVLDGQWVTFPDYNKIGVLVFDSVVNANVNYSFSLIDLGLIPDDGYIYEIMYLLTTVASSTGAFRGVGTDLMQQSWKSSNDTATHDLNGTTLTRNKIINISCGVKLNTCRFYLAAYRRVGTNE